MVVFLIVIAVEALVIVALVVAFFTSGQSLPGINFQSYVRPRCMNLSVLQLGPNSTGISGNRTVEFGCLIWDSRYNVFQRSTALSRVSGLADWSIGGGPHPMSAVPTFKVPTGYLELYLGGYGCGQHDVGIVSGAPAVFTDYHWEYYYCAVISNAVGSTQPFTVHWSQFKDLSFVPPSINGEQARAPAMMPGLEGFSATISTIPSTNVGEGGESSRKLFPAGPQKSRSFVGPIRRIEGRRFSNPVFVFPFSKVAVERFELVLSRQASQGKQGCESDRQRNCKTCTQQP